MAKETLSFSRCKFIGNKLSSVSASASDNWPLSRVASCYLHCNDDSGARSFQNGARRKAYLVVLIMQEQQHNKMKIKDNDRDR